jgi:hypothetical protein
MRLAFTFDADLYVLAPWLPVVNAKAFFGGWKRTQNMVLATLLSRALEGKTGLSSTASGIAMCPCEYSNEAQ